MQRRKFSDQTKWDAVNSVLSGTSVREVADRLAVHENVLRRWVKAYRSEGSPGVEGGFSVPQSSLEVERLKRQIAQLRAERDALAKEKRATLPKASSLPASLLDAVEEIMVEEGYAAVSTRRVAKKVGVTAAAVHYYFPTTDDLLLAAFRRKKEIHDEGVELAFGSHSPARSLWKFYTDTARTAIGIEFRAMVNNRKIIRKELARDIEQSRRQQAERLAEYMQGSARFGNLTISPLCLATLIANIGRGLVGEEVLGVTCGHAETKAFVDGLLQDLEELMQMTDRRDAPEPRNRSGPKAASRRTQSAD